MVEPRVISLGEGNHKLVGSLIASEDSNSSLLDSSGVHERDELEEQRRLLLEEIGSFCFDGGLELSSVVSGYSVPRLGLSEVH